MEVEKNKDYNYYFDDEANGNDDGSMLSIKPQKKIETAAPSGTAVTTNETNTASTVGNSGQNKLDDDELENLTMLRRMRKRK